MRAVYLDTNCYTALLEEYRPSDYPSLGKALRREGGQVLLSPLNVIEFLLTPDELQRERLIYLAQHICGPRLLATVEELITDFIATVGNQPTLSKFRKADHFAAGELAAAWARTRADRRRTLMVERRELVWVEAIRRLHAAYHAHLRRGGGVHDLFEAMVPIVAKDASGALEALKQMSETRRRQVAPPRGAVELKLHDCILLAITTVVCGELSVFPQPITAMWKTLGIQSSRERLDYCTRQLPFLRQRGPLIGIGAVMAAQGQRRYNPGNALDCFHAAYLAVVDALYTRDQSLLEIAAQFDKSPRFAKFRSFEELQSRI